MSSFHCEKCNKPILDTPGGGYKTECEHYPKNKPMQKEIKKECKNGHRYAHYECVDCGHKIEKPTPTGPQDEIRKIWEEMKLVKRYQEGKYIPGDIEPVKLVEKYEEIETLFGHESTLSKAIVYYLNKK